MPAKKKKLLRMPEPLVNWFSKTIVRRFLLAMTFFLITLAILALHFLPERITLEVGQVSPLDIKSNRYLTFQDKEATEQKRREAAFSIKDVYELNGEILTKNLDKITQSYTEVKDIINDNSFSEQDKAKALEELGIDLNANALPEIINIEAIKLQALETQSKLIVESIFVNGVNADTLDFALERIYTEIDLLNLSLNYRQLMNAILRSIEFEPNLVYNSLATEQRREEARDKVEEVNVIIQKDEKIVSAGEVLTQRQIDILTWLGYKNRTSPLLILLGLSLFIGLMMFLVAIFLKYYRRDLYRNEKYLLLLMLLVLTTVVFSKIIFSINLSSNLARAEQVGHLIPVAAGSMLIAILLDVRLAVFMAGIFAIFVGLITGQIPFVVTALTSSLMGVYGVSYLNQRSDLARTGLYIALANIISVSALGVLYNYEWPVFMMALAFAVGNGILSSVLTIGILPYLETAFKITTSVRLLELSNPNHPLLKRLLLEAPGTYHHSIIVGNLGEAAADVIGADSLLVRAGAYFHDIGKIKRPYFFVENQLAGENPHDKIAASLSTLIITSHVKDGVELAKEHGVPEVIIDLIEQHHGQTLVKYFYHKAKETEKVDTIKEEDYRYDAPKPQTKEAALILLADTVEAAVRSLKDPTPGKIEGLVRNLIKDRLNDGQLDECDLTFKDLDKIANTFVRVLTGILHSRIEYPESVLKALEKKKKGEKDVIDNNQSAKSSGTPPPAGS